MDTTDQIVLAFDDDRGGGVGNNRHGPSPGVDCRSGETVVLEVHAEGAQVYECKASPDAKLTWQFANPLQRSLLMAKRSVATMPVQIGN
jgi:hypothetical protein